MCDINSNTSQDNISNMQLIAAINTIRDKASDDVQTWGLTTGEFWGLCLVLKKIEQNINDNTDQDSIAATEEFTITYETLRRR